MMKSNHMEALNPEIQKVNEYMYNIRDLRMFKRYQTVLMYLKGRKYAEIADALGCNGLQLYPSLQGWDLVPLIIDKNFSFPLNRIQVKAVLFKGMFQLKQFYSL